MVTKQRTDNEQVNRLEEIREGMLDLLEEAESLILKSGNKMAYARATSYWIPTIKIALTKDHGMAAGIMVDMEDTLKELEEG